jgi:dTDP-4-dehydrorhamnose reductase
MKIILTGSNGLLGQKIMDQLLQDPEVNLIATAKGENRYPIQTGYQYESVDLTDAARWKTIFEKYQPDVIINGGAMTQVDVCEDEKSLCDAINVGSVAILCDLCKTFGTHLIHVSTDFIFDGEKGELYKEEDLPQPVNYYGMSKWKAEQVIAASGVNAAILRTILLYGVVHGLSRSNIVLWVKQSLEQGKKITVVEDQSRCPTLAEDLATACISAAKLTAKGIYHISGPEQMSVINLARRVAKFWHLDDTLISEIDSLSLNQRAKRPPHTGFNLEKAQKTLQYYPHTLEEGLAILDKQLQQYQ